MELYGDRERAARATAREENTDTYEKFTSPGPGCDVGFCIHRAVMLGDASVLVVGNETQFSITLLSIVCLKTGEIQRGPRQWLNVCQATIIIPFRDNDHFLLLGGNIPISTAASCRQSLPQEGGYSQILDAITMTFEEGPYITVGGLSARDYFAAVPLPHSDEKEQKLTLLLGCAHDVNLTGYIVVNTEMPQDFTMTDGEENNYITKVLTLKLEGYKAEARDRIWGDRITQVCANKVHTMATTTVKHEG
jgi:hypothetical protein